ncbi:unnamed protein product [marine sediment metagenome]|uniref:Uncharacterized protein n=1 Tax=marine sediment metagenome TaxID=412755 RepID=X1TSS6_9ZZZZ
MSLFIWKANFQRLKKDKQGGTTGWSKWRSSILSDPGAVLGDSVGWHNGNNWVVDQKSEEVV